ncbi:MAG: GNAT family N-acetyltransferase [Gemmatimonadetes bacterium]|nr:GNAT family N-acetyltransferase [Gemmatimonadota bacterium]
MNLPVIPAGRAPSPGPSLNSGGGENYRSLSLPVPSCTLRVYPSIHQVPAAEWDSLLGADDLQATHRFIRTCQEAQVEDARYRHLMVYQDGALAGVASLCMMRVKLDLLSTGGVRWAIRRVRGWRAGFLEVPVVFCGLPVSFGQSCLRIHPEANTAAVLEVVRGAAESCAVEVGAGVVCFKEFTPAESTVLQPLTGRGYLRLASLPSCRMVLPWPSFEAYLASMRAGYRRQVTATLRARERLGIAFRKVEDFGAEVPRIFPLYEQVMAHAEFQLERLNLQFFARLNENLPRESSAILVEREGELLAAAILLRSPGAVTFLLAGLDYGRHRELQSYPQLVTEVVAEAIRSGAGALEMGQTSYALKQRLGAQPSARHLFFRHRQPVMHRLFHMAGGALFPELALPARQVFRATDAASASVPSAAPGAG